MIYLKIENGKGYFRNSNNQMQQIHDIRKEDILTLLDFATDSSVDFEMDEMTDDNIQNEAHRIIYDGLYRKFKELLYNKARFVDESESLYKDAIKKYQDTQFSQEEFSLNWRTFKRYS